MKNRRNYYRLLQVQADAPTEIIRSSFRTLMRELKQHPDLGGSHWEATLLNEAYETLTDPKRRAAYDRGLPHITSRSSKPQSEQVCPSCRRAAVPESSGPSGDKHRHDRRSSDRMKREQLISYSGNGSRRTEARLVNFCPGGMLFLSGEPLPVKSLIEISSSLVEAVACVTHCVLTADKQEQSYAVGVSFTAVRFLSPKGAFVSVNV
jgi:hypothetical protein